MGGGRASPDCKRSSGCLGLTERQYIIRYSDGRGSDIMIAIPSFGGLVIAMLTVFVVPMLYCWVGEGEGAVRRATFLMPKKMTILKFILLKSLSSD